MSVKKLISIADIEQLLDEGKKECTVTSNTIVTPAAVDLAEEKGVRFVEQNVSINPTTTTADSDQAVEDILQLLMNKDILQTLIASLKDDPYEAKQDDTGLKIIYGKTVKMVPLEKNNKQICGQILLKTEKAEAGFLTLQDSDFYIKSKTEEINLILEGELTVRINGRSYKAQEGDVIAIPAGIQLERSAIGKAKVFYVRS